MCVYWGISCCTRQILVVFVWNVDSLPSLILFSQTEIDHKDDVGLLFFPDQEIIRLDVSMEEALVMNVLYTVKNLKSNHDDGFNRERFAVLFKQWLERIAQRFHNHDILLSFSKVFVNLKLMMMILWGFLCRLLFRLRREVGVFWLRSRVEDSLRWIFRF